MTKKKEINLETARADYVGAATKAGTTLKVYAGQITEQMGANWAFIAKKKLARDCNEQEKEIRDGVAEERAAFYDLIEKNYKGTGDWKDIARVYWNRVVDHCLPAKPKSAGATEARSLEEFTNASIPTALRRAARDDDEATPDWVLEFWDRVEIEYIDLCPGMTREKIHPAE